MRALLSSPFTAAVIGGVAVATTFLAFGVTGRRVTRTIIEQSAVTGSGDRGASLTPHAIYERDAPGVVFVKAVVTPQARNPFNVLPVRRHEHSTGSGFLITTSGYILTDFHLIEGADPRTGVTVEFEDDVARTAMVVGADTRDDLALLKVDMVGIAGIRPLVLGDSTSVKVGDPTLAIANPFGYDRTMTSGIVSALQRQIQAPDGFTIENVIQTDAPADPVNSGGPLLDADGRVIGVNSQIATGGVPAGGSGGVAFAVPIDTVKAFIPRVETSAADTPARDDPGA
jgi:S1-C subfamily serine protease